jgi:hypothetical protein
MAQKSYKENFCDIVSRVGFCGHLRIFQTVNEEFEMGRLLSSVGLQNLAAESIVDVSEVIVERLEEVDSMSQICNAHDFTTRMHRKLGHCIPKQDVHQRQR